jgi:hypothetical protein
MGTKTGAFDEEEGQEKKRRKRERNQNKKDTYPAKKACKQCMNQREMGSKASTGRQMPKDRKSGSWEALVT